MIKETIPTEHEEQREFVSWFRQNYDPVRIFAIPNGDKRSRSAGARLKAEGVSAGVPDLFIPDWRVWVEMKRQKRSTTRIEQREWMQYLESVGYQCYVCHGCERAQELVKYLVKEGKV